MVTIQIKPLSTNAAWRGRRFPTTAYQVYQHDLAYLLPSSYDIPEGKLRVQYTFGVSSKTFDYDNAIKQFQDSLCKKYCFDDRRIYKAEIEKVDVEKGQEFISFSIDQI